MGDTVEGTGAPSVTRALAILTAIAEVPDGLRMTDLAERLGLPKSSMHVLLGALGDVGWIERTPDRRYHLGLAAWEVGQAYEPVLNLTRIAQPVLDRLRDSVHETSRLAVLDGLENVYVAKSDSGQPLALDTAIGSRLPAHVTGLGKALLAGLSDDDLHLRLRDVVLERYTPNTITDTDHLLAELRQVRARGWAEDNQEAVLGVRCLATPIRDHTNTVVASISLSVPTIRFRRREREHALAALQIAAEDLSQQLGFRTLL